MGGAIISAVTFGICALIMIGIGVSQLRSEKPVGFYSGEKAPEEDEISDVHMWNKKHGTMWVAYGVIIVLTWVCGLIIGDSIWLLVPYFIGLFVPIVVMIWYHNILIKKYKIKN